jgi:transposase-like protein
MAAREGITVMTDSLSTPHFKDDTAARKLIERIRWPNGPVCPYCGTFDHAYPLKKEGWHRCGSKECRKDFTVTMGTVMERSHIPLHKWMIGFYLMNASKKGISAHQLHRTLGIRYQSAWFMCHRIREAMRAGGLTPLGGEGKVVEADETYYGDIPEAKRPTHKKSGRAYSKDRRGTVGKKRAILALVERGGTIRSFHIAGAYADSVVNIVRDNISDESRLHTDESKLYHSIGHEFAAHETVKHSDDEYVRGDVTTNTVEGYFSIFKRGMKGIYQHCSEKHLHRYLAEYDHRYNHRVALGFNDNDRTIAAIKGAEGKRLTYRQPR